VRAGYTASELISDSTVFLANNTSSPAKNTKCYNKFLLYNNLPILKEPQTLKTFIHHLQLYNFTQKYKISINSKCDETHIYTHFNEKLLSNHTLIPTSCYHNFYHLPLQSSSNDSDFNLELNNQLNTNDISDNTHHLNLNIATHNVRGFNSATKREAWQDYCLNHNITISGITETKIANKTNLFFCNSQHFTYYWANSETSAEGTAIMIKNYLKPHVHNCLTHPGGAIALDLFFKNEIKIRIISVYLSTTDSTKRNLTQNTVINWIQQASQLHIQPIILGDFNTQDNTLSSSTKFKLVNFLNHNNFYDIGLHFNNTQHTWSNQTSSSRIDYIWTNQTNIQFLLSFNLESSQTSTLSDHLILLTQWTFPNAYSKPSRKHTKISRRIFNYKIMTQELWEDFANSVTHQINSHKTPLSTDTTESIETTWHKI
jgi:endonuclease/exonuclease/phosphatase family metal-dependent hydrolase